MYLKATAKLMLLTALAGCTVTAVGTEDAVKEASEQAEPREDPKRDKWVDACMKDSGWYNEDGYPYCQCIVSEAGTSKSWKALKGSKIESICAAKVLPSKKDSPYRHWVAECVVSGHAQKYCKCMAEKLQGPVILSDWKKTKAGSEADASCRG